MTFTVSGNISLLLYKPIIYNYNKICLLIHTEIGFRTISVIQKGIINLAKFDS